MPVAERAKPVPAGPIKIAGPVPVASVASAIESPPIAPARVRSRGTLPVVGMFALTVIVAIYLGRAILMPILFGMIMAVMLAPLVEKLSRLHISEPIGAALVMAAMLGLLVLVVELLVLPARDVLAELPEQVQALLGHLLEWVRSFRLGNWLSPRNSAELTNQATAKGMTLTGDFLLHRTHYFHRAHFVANGRKDPHQLGQEQVAGRQQKIGQ